MRVEIISNSRERKVRIYKPVSAVLVHCSGNIADERIEIRRVDGLKGGHDVICPRTKMMNLFEVAAHGEGLFVNKNTGSRGMVEVGSTGCVSLSDQRYMEVELSDLDQAKTYTVYGLENGEVSDSLVVYHPMVINSDEVLKEYGTKDKELVAVPFANLDKVELIEDDGQSVSYTPHELEALMEKENDLCCVEDTGAGEVAYYGFKKFAVLGIGNVETVKINKKAGAPYELYFIDEQ